MLVYTLNKKQNIVILYSKLTLPSTNWVTQHHLLDILNKNTQIPIVTTIAEKEMVIIST